MVFENYNVALTSNGLAGYRQLKRTEDSQKEVLKADAFVKRETEYFKNNIGKISSAEEFVKDTRILRFALSSYGLEEELFKTAYIKRVLESDLTDTASAANRISDPRWQNFAQAFIKSVPELPGPLQEGFSDKQIAKSYAIELSRYKTDTQIDTLKSESDKFRTLMKNIKTTDDLFKPENRAALTFIKKAFNVENDTASNEQIAGYLNATNFSATPPERWQNARKALSFFDDIAEAKSVGTTTSKDTKPNSEKVIETVIKNRFEQELKNASGVSDYNTKAEAFRTVIRNLTSADDIDSLLDDKATMKFLKEAFNLGKDITDNQTVKTYLTQTDDTGIPTAWKQVRELLNFHTITDEAPYSAPTYGELSGVLTKHKEREIRVGSNIDRFDRLKKEADYFKLNINLTASNENITSNSRLLRFAMNSFGIDTVALDSQKALKVLNNDYDFKPNLSSDTRLKEFQKAYSFSISKNTLRTLDDDIGKKTEDAFLKTTLIAAVGNSDEDLRLALYFEDRISQVAQKEKNNKVGWLRIIGEPPLATAFQRVFGLPSSIGKLDVDAQKEVYAKRASSVLGSSDLGKFSEKDFRDKFINLFLSRSNNSRFNSSSASIASTILNGGG
jgi:Protein of unknown function (DUF1217)